MARDLPAMRPDRIERRARTATNLAIAREKREISLMRKAAESEALAGGESSEIVDASAEAFQLLRRYCGRSHSHPRHSRVPSPASLTPRRRGEEEGEEITTATAMAIVALSSDSYVLLQLWAVRWSVCRWPSQAGGERELGEAGDVADAELLHHGLAIAADGDRPRSSRTAISLLVLPPRPPGAALPLAGRKGFERAAVMGIEIAALNAGQQAVGPRA